MTEQQQKARHKNCEWCDVEYCDITKRFVGKSCSKKCANAKMSATRRANGSYVRTEEQNKKLSKSIKKMWEKGTFDKPEVREKWSMTMKKSWADGSISAENHWARTAEGKLKLSEIGRKKKYSNQALINFSKGQRNRIRTKRETLYTSARGGFREDLGSYFRSNWEANYARILLYTGKQWTYEPKSFTLNDGGSYTPDFEVEGVYVELKGRIHDYTTDKYNRFVREYNLPTLFIGPEEYRALRAQYKHLISWEGK